MPASYRSIDKCNLIFFSQSEKHSITFKVHNAPGLSVGRCTHFFCEYFSVVKYTPTMTTIVLGSV